MTEDELREARAAKDAAEQAQIDAGLDAAVQQLTLEDAVTLVSRREGLGGTESEHRRHQRQLAAALRMTGMTMREIAEEMGIGETSVKRLLLEAQQLNAHAAISLLQTRAVPLAIDNLIVGLERGHERYTLETLKGGGILKAHGQPGGHTTPPVLQVVFAAPKDAVPALPPGAAHGAPLTVDVQKVD